MIYMCATGRPQIRHLFLLAKPQKGNLDKKSDEVHEMLCLIKMS